MKLAAPSALGTGRRGGFSSVLVNASRPDPLRLDPHAFLLPSLFPDPNCPSTQSRNAPSLLPVLWDEVRCSELLLAGEPLRSLPKSFLLGGQKMGLDACSLRAQGPRPCPMSSPLPSTDTHR